TEHCAGVGGGERPARFGDEDDAVEAEIRERDERRQGEVAGTADDGVALAGRQERGRGGGGWTGVDDGQIGAGAVEAGHVEGRGWRSRSGGMRAGGMAGSGARRRLWGNR